MKRCLYLLLTLLLLASNQVRAETVAATTVYANAVRFYQATGRTSWFTEKAAACSSYASGWVPSSSDPTDLYCYNATTGQNQGILTAKWDCPTDYTNNGTSCIKQTCPDSTWALSGGVCSRPDCVAPETRNPTTGLCESACTSKAGQESFGWLTVTVGGPSPYGSFCAAGCEQYVTGPVTAPGPEPYTYYTNGKTRTEYAKWQYSGGTCTGDTSPKTATNPPVNPPKKPNCSADEGVMTTNTGSVHCVPAGTDSAQTPIVKKEVEKKVNSDNSTNTIETTTTRDPSTGAEAKVTNTTNCVGSSCTTSSSSSSTSGGTNGAGAPDGSQSNDLCTKNPTLDICTGKLAKEETLGKIRDSLDPKDKLDTSSLDTAKSDYEKKADDHKKFIDAFADKQQSDEGGMLHWAMIPEVSATSCVPFTGNYMGRAITMDWCDELEKIRSLAGYAFYVFTAFALFAIFAGSTSSGGKS